MFRKSLNLLTVAALGLPPTLAHADEPSTNWSNFPGSKCVKALSSGTLYVQWTRAENTHTTQSLRVSCPIDRQNVTGNLGSGSYVWVIDDHATEEVTCSLAVRRASTDTEISRQTVSTASNRDSSTPVKLSFNSAVTTGSDDVYVVSCLIPPNSGGRSSVVAVRVVETD